MEVVGVVLAAGGGRRFGSAKQLAVLDGRPLVAHAVDAACDAAELDRVVVVLGAEVERVRAALPAGRAEAVTCADWREGIAASLRCGVAAAGDADWTVVTLADEPRLPGAAIARVVGAARVAPAGTLAVRVRWGGGRPGHPVALSRALAPRVAELRGDRGARDLFADAPVTEVDCSDLAGDGDVDTPSDLDALRRDRPV